MKVRIIHYPDHVRRKVYRFVLQVATVTYKSLLVIVSRMRNAVHAGTMFATLLYQTSWVTVVSTDYSPHYTRVHVYVITGETMYNTHFCIAFFCVGICVSIYNIYGKVCAI